MSKLHKTPEQPVVKPEVAAGSVDPSLNSMANLWILRILVLLKGHSAFITDDGISNESLAKMLSLSDGSDGNENFDRKAAVAKLRALHKQAESTANSAQVFSCLHENVQRLASIAGLSDPDCRILEFMITHKMDRNIAIALNFTGDFITPKFPFVLSTVVDLPISTIEECLTRGPLRLSGLISAHYSRYSDTPTFRLISSSFAEKMMSDQFDPLSVLDGHVYPAPQSTISFEDYSRPHKSISFLRSYLCQALAEHRVGVNILIYGKRDADRANFARALASDVGRDLFEVVSMGADGYSIGPSERLDFLCLAQAILPRRGTAMLVFDKIDELFKSIAEHPLVAATAAGTVNLLLKQNLLPTIWIASKPPQDSTFIRKFDIVLELPHLPSRQRESMLTADFGSVLDRPTLKRLSGIASLPHEVVTRAVSVARCVLGEIESAALSEAAGNLVEGTLKAEGRFIPKRATDISSELYDLSVLNADADLLAIREGLEKIQSGRLCLYGPPGTGKTLFGHWLADELELPIIVKRASDLLEKWVGSTEENIANAFQQAENSGGILMIDEVDSFVSDRRMATHGWEVTHINEMLTQIESFSGIFIASTNLMGGLDQAALRRFDFKIKFDYMRAEGAWRLFLRHCEAMNLGSPAPALKGLLDRLSSLTPGDFAVVAKRHRISPINSSDLFIQALSKECSLKMGKPGCVGFL